MSIFKMTYIKKQQVKYEMLSIGDKITVYGGHGNYQLDTLFLAKKDIKPTTQELLNLGREYEPLPESLTINKDFPPEFF